MAENNIEIICKHIPDIKIIFQSGESFKFTLLRSFSQKITNNFDFKNFYECTCIAIPKDFLHLIEKSVNQIKEIQIIDTYSNSTDGNEHECIHSIKLPEVEISRIIDSSSGYAPWVLKISEKLL